MSDQRDTTPSSAVRHALTAVELLQEQNPSLAAQVRKILPGYAKALDQRGESVTVESLLDAASRGTEYLKSVSRPHNSTADFMTRYLALARGSEELPALACPPLYAAAQQGDANKIRELLAAGEPDTPHDQQLPLYAAAASGNKESLDLILSCRDYRSREISEAITHAAKHGHNEIIVTLLEHNTTHQNYTSCSAALIAAISASHLETTRILLEHAKIFPLEANQLFFNQVVKQDNPAFVDLLIAHGADPHTDEYYRLRAAILNRNTPIVKKLLALAQGSFSATDALYHAATSCYTLDKKTTEMIQFLLDSGADIHFKDDACLRETPCHELRQLLVMKGANIAALSPEHIAKISCFGYPETVAFLLDHGASDALISQEEKEYLHKYRASRERWLKSTRHAPPDGLFHKDATPFKPELFNTLLPVLEKEGYSDRMAHQCAYAAMAVFQSEDRILQYLQKWGSGKNLLHDAVCMMAFPNDCTNANLSDWGDAVLKHGPKMAKLITFCDRLPSPAKSDDGKTWSYLKTRTAIAQYAYKNAAQHPALATLCIDHAIDEDQFDKALTLAKRPKTTSNIPDISIDGQRFGMKGVTFKKLANDDIRGLFLGEMTDCCQSIGKFGSTCAAHGFVSKNGGFYVVETAQGDIIGQSWAWRGKDGELCLDSLETLGLRIDDAQWEQLMNETAKELTQRRDHDVTALHVGLGGNTPERLSQHFTKKTAKPVDYTGYRDSEKQVRVWKR